MFATLVLGLKVLEPWLSGDIARCLEMHLIEMQRWIGVDWQCLPPWCLVF